MRTAVASIHAMTLVGLEGHRVDVETHVGRGLVAFQLVGLPDASLREARDRVRSALQSCGLDLPEQKVTVNLSPANLPKAGSSFDLAVACSVLVAAGRIDPSFFAGAVLIGELGLDGSIRPVRGVLPSLVAAAALGTRRAIVPAACAAEAELVRGLEVRSFEHLSDLVHAAGGRAHRPTLLGVQVPSEGRASSSLAVADHGGGELDLAQVRGQEHARRCLEVAAAGGHHLHLVGEPGAGKSMLAMRLPTILPPLDDATALTVSAIHSLAGLLGEVGGLVRTPPLCAPHHTSTLPALVGGGHGTPRPGAVSLAHGGVLLLDEAPEFAPSTLDALRQPLEEGVVTIQRSAGGATFPASFQLVLTSNPCPCGHSGASRRACTCTSLQRRRYAARLSGPLRDRVDITVPMRTPMRSQLSTDEGETSRAVRERVLEARVRAAHRLAGTPWRLNRDVPGWWLRSRAPMDASLLSALESATERGHLSMRGADRVLRLAWTLADLAGVDAPGAVQFARALDMRRGGEEFDD